MIEIVGAAVLGLVVGNLLTVVVHRLPRMLDWDLRRDVAEASADLGLPAPPDPGPRPSYWQPGPQCVHCARALGGLDSLPLLGFLIQRGRCRACQGPIPMDMPIVELATAAAFGAVAWRIGFNATGIASAMLATLLVGLAAIDAREKLLPDALTLPGLWLGLICNAFGLFTDPTSAILGAAGGYAMLWGSHRLFLALAGRQGVWAGDFKLVALIGAWLGWQALPAVLVYALAAALLVLLPGLVLGRVKKGQEVAFGPYLAAAGLGLLLGGPGFATPLLP